MYKKYIKKYVQKLNINDLDQLGKEYGLVYNQDELIIIYQFIQYHIDDLLNENIKVFEEIKNKINPNLYKQILSYYIDYKHKILG